MKPLSFEAKKLFRSAGFVYLCIGLLVIDMLLCIMMPSFTGNDEYIESYEGNINYVIRVAERNLLEYEATAGKDNYIVRYQRDIIARYGDLLKKGVKPERVRGWNEFFDNTSAALLPILAAVTAAIALTAIERDNGTHLLMLTTAKGRGSFRSKLMLLLVLSFALEILMTAVGLAGIHLRFGLSSPLVPLCSVERFAYCPYDISILGYLAASTALKSLALFALAAFAAVATAFTRSSIVGIATIAGILTAGYALASLGTSDTLALLNPYTALLCDPFFERYRALNIFGGSVSILVGLCLLLVSSCLIIGALYAILFACMPGGDAVSSIERNALSALRKLMDKLTSSLPRRKHRRHGLLLTEAKKSFFKSQLILLCLLMLVIKLRYAAITAPEITSAEEYYREVCASMCGELTEEKRERIEQELLQCSSVIAQFDSMKLEVQSGGITGEEYSRYLDDYYRATTEHYAYTKLSEQCACIDAAVSRGIAARITYDSGWISLFSGGADILLLAFLLLFFCGTYESEYKSGFAVIARTSARGMEALHRCKAMLAVIVSSVAFILFSAIDISFLLMSYSLPDANCPYAVIGPASSSVSLLFMAILRYALGWLIAVLFSLGACILSRLLKRSYIVIPAGALAIGFLSMLS